MGCISSKAVLQESPNERRATRKGSVDRRVAHVNPTRVDEGSKNRLDGGDVKVMLIDKKTTSSKRYDTDQIGKNKEGNSEATAPGFGKVPNSREAEQIAAGWPSWLASVAGEALNGLVPRRATTFEKLEKIGQGTYSCVYKARDIVNDKIVALKKVRFDKNDMESVKFMAREIIILRKLDHPNIIKLEGLITSPMSSCLYLVFEYMEHDLTGLASIPRLKFSEPQVKCYMQQLLSGLDHCHKNGVLHRDIKGSNLLIDSNGILKIADFGLASFFDPKKSGSLTSRVVTLWYRPPELLLGATKYGVAVDLWSTGCILGELYAGRPILPGKTEVEQLHKIFKLCGSPSEDYWAKSKSPLTTAFKHARPYKRCIEETFKDFPVPAVRLLENLLSIDPARRATADSVLKSEYFTVEPVACDPSSLPKYPPSKEIDAKRRGEEAMREVGGRDQMLDPERKGPKGSLGKEIIPTSTTNAQLAMSFQNGYQIGCSKRNEMYNSGKRQTVSGFLGDPSQQRKAVPKDFPEYQGKQISYSGPLVRGTGMLKVKKEVDDHPPALPGRSNLSSLSGLVAARTSSAEAWQGKCISSHQQETMKHAGRPPCMPSYAESSRKEDNKCYVQKGTYSPQSGGKKFDSRDPSLQVGGPMGDKIYFSGPLVGSKNVEQMLKEQDRHIQEFARRARRQKEKEKLQKSGR